MGNYDIEQDNGKLVYQSYQETIDKKYLTLPIICLGTFTMFVMSIMIPGESYQEQMTYIMFWAFATAVVFSIIIYYGKEFVNSPKFFHKYKKE